MCIATRYAGVGVAVLLTLPTLGWAAQPNRPFFDELSSSPACAGAGQTPATDAAPATDDRLLFYSIPQTLLTAARNEVLVRVWVDGERYLEERAEVTSGAVEMTRETSRQALEASRPEGAEALLEAPDRASDGIVLELLADRPEIRAQLERLAAGHDVQVEVTVGGESLDYESFDDFARASEGVVASMGLPFAAQTAATVFSISTDKPQDPQNFYVCGDGSCGGGTPPIGETCESCPEDCGGPCSICGNGFCGGTETCSTCAADCGPCATCPLNLGTQERQVYLGSTPYTTYCADGWPGIMYYTYTRNDYKKYTVQRTQQCDGSITETVVPGSTTYFSAFCWKYTGIYCFSPWAYASPICF